MRLILIHGAWQGSWAWSRFLPVVAEAGFRVEAIDLPGNGSDLTPAAEVSLDRYVAHVGGRIQSDEDPVVLMAHSGGGVIASEVAERLSDRVKGVIYVAGMMLPSGGTFGDVVGPLVAGDPSAAGIRPHLVWSPDGLISTVPADAARRIFYQDCTQEDAQSACARLTPQPEGGRAVSPRLTPKRFGTVPRLYVETRQDRSVVLAAQRRMQVMVPGAAVVSLDSGHAPQLAMPEKLAACVIPWLAARS
jgi:pimeloyl-ACP methyl ester carboxylesterase